MDSKLHSAASFQTMHRLVAAVTVIVCLGVAQGCNRGPADGLEKFPVIGEVHVDGAPAEGVVVRFFRDGKSGSSNADTPLGVTQPDGTFNLSTNGDGDGAVAGDYVVTFTWKMGNSPAAKDRLAGRYTNLANSEVKVTVLPQENRLEAFRLEAPKDEAVAESEEPAAPNPNVPNAGAQK